METKNTDTIIETIKLTQFAHGAGCGCKIAPKVLHEILHNQTSEHNTDAKLLVGNNTNDDAAVYELDEENCIISTTDFFTPIVNDAYSFGQIAATNAISDVYAMGGKPIMALAILGWPIEKLPAELANKVIEGARNICTKAGIVLAGGHSIDSPEPIFGLSVNGLVAKKNIKKNNTAQVGDYLFITKPIGVGILATAEKRDQLQTEHIGIAVQQMTQLNSIGAILGNQKYVTALTDVTGFGLAGHLVEMCEGANISAELYWNKIPLITDLSYYLKNRILPDATFRNWNSYGTKIGFDKGVPVMDAFNILPDPQTSGGLLIAINENHLTEIVIILKENGLENYLEPIGRFTEKKEKVIQVIL
jgi:selenide, water dikinase